MDLSRCRALVTGGAVRIGRALVEALAAQGCDVALHYRRSAAEADALARQLRPMARIVPICGDLGSACECRRIVEESWRALGGFNILINSAAVFHKDTLHSATANGLDSELAINFRAPMRLSRAFAEKMRGDGSHDAASAEFRPPRGKILHLLDRRIADADPECLPYEISKKMLAAAIDEQSRELAPDIAVNGIAPGAILPPRTDGTDKGETVRDLAGPTLLQSPCGPEAVAETAVFLLKSDFIAGQIIYVDNGRHLIH